MTPDDPALRALLAAQIDHPLPGEPFTDTCILARDVFRILAAAEAAPLDAPSGGSPYVTRLTNSLSYHLTPEAAPLDVERLARAIHTVQHIGDLHAAGEGWCREEAEAIAREYAALRSSDTEDDTPIEPNGKLRFPDTEENRKPFYHADGTLCPDWGDHSNHGQSLRSPDTETAGDGT